MNVEIFENSSLPKLQKQINAWLDDQCWNEEAEEIKEVIDIKLINCEDCYTAMILYKFI